MAAWVEIDPVTTTHSNSVQQPGLDADEMLLGDNLRRPSTLKEFLARRASNVSHEKSKVTFFSTFLALTTLEPSGTATLYWNALICMVAAYNLIFLPMRIGFPYFEERYRGYWYFLDYLSDIYYLIDIVVRMRTSFLMQGCIEYNWKSIALHYLKSWDFVLDLLAILPLDFLIIENQSTRYQNYVVGVRSNRLIKYNRIYTFISRAESRSDFPNIIRLSSLVLILCSLIHINSCVYFILSTILYYNHMRDDEWVYPGTEESLPLFGIVVIPDNSFINQYFHSLHWSTQMLTTIAEVPSPTITIEYIYAIVLLLFAVLMFATLVGNVGNILINLNAARTRFESRLDNVKQYMHNRNINEKLQENVLRWFDHLWEKNRGIDEQETLHNLPNKLRAQIAFSANRKVLANNDIYQLGDLGYKIDLVLKLRSELFPPRETVYRRGNIGNDMYIIRSGKVLLTRRQNNQPDKELGEGDCFGMNCVINFDEFGRERSETATTNGFCDILLLEKKDLVELLIDYPDVKEELSRKFQQIKTELQPSPRTHQKKMKEGDIALVTKDVNDLIKKYDSLRERYGALFEEHNKLKHAVGHLARDSLL